MHAIEYTSIENLHYSLSYNAYIILYPVMFVNISRMVEYRKMVIF